MSTLTRLAAHVLVDACGNDFPALRRLARNWIGHDEFDAGTLADCLHDYIGECALSDDVRGNGPHDDDPTGLLDPDAAPEPRHNYARDNALEGLSNALTCWQVSQGLPQQCADEQLATCRTLTLAQRLWLNSFVALWELTV